MPLGVTVTPFFNTAAMDESTLTGFMPTLIGFIPVCRSRYGAFTTSYFLAFSSDSRKELSMSSASSPIVFNGVSTWACFSFSVRLDLSEISQTFSPALNIAQGCTLVPRLLSEKLRRDLVTLPYSALSQRNLISHPTTC